MHFIVVGGGPTGIEPAAEVDELVHRHLCTRYPHFKGQVRVSVLDLVDRVRGQFGEKLSGYVMSQFRARDTVDLWTERNTEAVEANCLLVKSNAKLVSGFVFGLWAIKSAQLLRNRTPKRRMAYREL